MEGGPVRERGQPLGGLQLSALPELLLRLEHIQGGLPLQDAPDGLEVPIDLLV